MISTDYTGASECGSSVYEEYDPLNFLYGETEMRDAPVYATVNKRESTMLPSPPPKSIPSVPAATVRSTTVSIFVVCLLQLQLYYLFKSSYTLCLFVAIKIRLSIEENSIPPLRRYYHLHAYVDSRS